MPRPHKYKADRTNQKHSKEKGTKCRVTAGEPIDLKSEQASARIGEI